MLFLSALLPPPSLFLDSPFPEVDLPSYVDWLDWIVVFYVLGLLDYWSMPFIINMRRVSFGLLLLLLKVENTGFVVWLQIESYC